MRIARPSGHVLLCLVSLAAAGCVDGSPTQIEPNETTITLQSDAGDFIGQGQTYSYTPETSSIQVNYTTNFLRVAVVGAWIGEFWIPGNATTLQDGTYTGAVLYPSQDAAKPQMNWSSQDRDCTSVTGSFTLQNVRYTGGNLRDFDLTFEQHCNGAAPALRGTIHVRR